MNEQIIVATDWWSVGATIFSGVITAIATMGAVIYTNYRTKNNSKNKKPDMKKNEQNSLSKANMLS